MFVHGSLIEPVLTYSTHPDYGEAFGAQMLFSDLAEPPYDALDAVVVTAPRQVRHRLAEVGQQLVALYAGDGAEGPGTP